MHLLTLRHGEEPLFRKASKQMRFGGKYRLSSAESQGKLNLWDSMSLNFPILPIKCKLNVSKSCKRTNAENKITAQLWSGTLSVPDLLSCPTLQLPAMHGAAGRCRGAVPTPQPHSPSSSSTEMLASCSLSLPAESERFR